MRDLMRAIDRDFKLRLHVCSSIIARRNRARCRYAKSQIHIVASRRAGKTNEEYYVDEIYRARARKIESLKFRESKAGKSKDPNCALTQTQRTLFDRRHVRVNIPIKLFNKLRKISDWMWHFQLST